MKQLVLLKGSVNVQQVPSPTVEPGAVLVRVSHSCISIGTELAGVRSSGEPTWKRALKHPEEVRRVISMVAEQGIRRIHRMVKSKLTSATALGYSAAGIVIEVGEGVSDLRVGDRVACAGAQCAHHAEVIRVPRNLAIKVPESVDFEAASTATLGAIAMQGVRRLGPTLGESFVVLGLGILGQIASQILRANGCRVIGIDLDRSRIALAKTLGIDAAFHPDDAEAIDHVHRLTDGFGVDGVVVTAASESDSLISQAFQMCRKKGRVVLVGDVGLDIKREDIFKKELDFLISSSYGPGRYDPTYEEGGIDYPLPYVRWTENRNLGEYLHLIAAGRLDVRPLVSRVVDVDVAGQAYEELKGGGADLVVLVRYPQEDGHAATTKIPNPGANVSRPGAVRVGLVGAGGFAKGMHLPNMEAMPEKFHLQAVMSRTGLNAQETAKQFGAAYATTELSRLLQDPDVDALLVATRHNLHAQEVLAGLRAGKHVLVEKPLALTQVEVDEIAAFYRENSSGPVLLTGFNRRFSPSIQRMREIVEDRSGPMILNYRMNAGYVPQSEWVHGEEGGGRNLGEACHIYDLFTFLTGARVEMVSASAIRPASVHYGSTDNFVATIRFDDGSVATLTYTALGSKLHPKERMEVFVDGKVLLLDDYRTLDIVGARQRGVTSKLVDKGQKQELIEFARCIQNGGEWPIPLWQQIQATEIALRVDAMIRQ
jgi:predicted dehydrogenase/threonine dehydrogenase-like Zn-dependent dehydrogenase